MGKRLIPLLRALKIGQPVFPFAQSWIAHILRRCSSYRAGGRHSRPQRFNTLSVLERNTGEAYMYKVCSVFFIFFICLSDFLGATTAEEVLAKRKALDNRHY